LHTAYAAVTVVGIANRAGRLGKRHSRAEIEALIQETGFDKYLKDFGHWEGWVSGQRGRQR
jgi:hypothetical protein